MEILRLLPRVLDALERENVSYALIGGLASNLWVSNDKVRETFDIDFAIRGFWNPDRVMERLQSPSVSALRSPDLNLRRVKMKRLLLNDTIVDFVTAKSAAFMDSVFMRIQDAKLGSKQLPVVSAEDVFLFKGMSKRESDIAPMTFLAETKDFDHSYAEMWSRKLGIWSFAKRAMPAHRRGK